MMAILQIGAVLLGCAAAVLCAMAIILLTEIAASFLPARRPRPISTPRPFRFAVLVPAHDEALVIGRTLASIFPQLSRNDRLIVIADNCTDETGRIAEDAGAEVFYRVDQTLRGKGYALDYAVHRLASDPPDAVIFVDADCIAEPGSLRAIAAQSLAHHRPVQARYELHSGPAEPSNYLKVASFAWAVKNHIRPLGLNRLGLPCQLMGTGMAFPWGVISRTDLNTGNIVEDLELGLNLAAAGTAPMFFPSAIVSSDFPVSQEGQQTQRTRWETGHLRMIWSRIPQLIRQGVMRGRWNLVVLATDAAVPPLTLLSINIGAALLTTSILAAFGGSIVPLSISLAAAVALASSIMLAARKLHINLISLDSLRLIGGYATSKFAIYAGAMTGKPIEWVRSKRD
jgi:cellulose synthase/poly-beta-1,6-N-acetylglucosamine synthase-like glycosyltransferase